MVQTILFPDEKKKISHSRRDIFYPIIPGNAKEDPQMKDIFKAAWRVREMVVGVST